MGSSDAIGPIVLVIIGLFAIAALGNYLRPTGDVIGSSGEILAIGMEVFEDPGFTTPLEHVDWGLLEPGENTSITCYIQNQRSWSLVAALNIQDWNPPEAADYMNLTWNYTGATIKQNQVIPISFTLSISPDIQNITTFTFNIILTEARAS